MGFVYLVSEYIQSYQNKTIKGATGFGICAHLEKAKTIRFKTDTSLKFECLTGSPGQLMEGCFHGDCRNHESDSCYYCGARCCQCNGFGHLAYTVGV